MIVSPILILDFTLVIEEWDAPSSGDAKVKILSLIWGGLNEAV